MTMRTWLATLVLLAVVLAGCSGAPGASSGGPSDGSAPPSTANEPPPTTDTGSSSEPSAGSTSAGPAASPSTSGAGLPAACADGFATYLTEIEPIVEAFDPATATLADLLTADQAVGDKSYELLQANDSTAPYSCSEVGLEWAYFDANTPWDAVLVVAGEAAPGTVAYLTAIRDMAAIDVAKLTDYGVEGCDAAVTSIKERVAEALAGGSDGARDMVLVDGLALLGLYKAYLADVRNEVCPRDELGNDEFDFFIGIG